MISHQVEYDAKIHPEENKLELANGSSVNYDFLIITTGPRLEFEEVEGLGPDGNTVSVCTADDAEHAYKKYQAIVKNLRSVVIGLTQFVSCFGPT